VKKWPLSSSHKIDESKFYPTIRIHLIVFFKSISIAAQKHILLGANIIACKIPNYVHNIHIAFRKPINRLVRKKCNMPEATAQFLEPITVGG